MLATLLALMGIWLISVQALRHHRQAAYNLHAVATFSSRLRSLASARHIFLCSDQTKPKCCNLEQGLVSWEHLKKRVKELQIQNPEHLIMRTKANCLQHCRDGPIALVYPDGVWYKHCSPEALDEILLEHIINGRIVDKYVLKVEPLKIE